MVFFQAALLAGYVYAHVLVRFVPLGIGALVHFGILAAAAVALPIGIAQGFDVPPAADIAPWLVGLFAVSIGLPFVALSASAPLLQAWFAATGHPQAHNPYVLYAASNLGSFAALIAYPILVEPIFTLRSQTELWAAGYATFAFLIAIASLFIARRARITSVVALEAAPSWRDRLAWVALSAIPAGFVIAVTSYLTTDVAAAPFLWVLPLALYLLTFVAVFRDCPWVAPESVAKVVPFLVAPLAIGLLEQCVAMFFLLLRLRIARGGRSPAARPETAPPSPRSPVRPRGSHGIQRKQSSASGNTQERRRCNVGGQV